MTEKEDATLDVRSEAQPEPLPKESEIVGDGLTSGETNEGEVTLGQTPSGEITGESGWSENEADGYTTDPETPREKGGWEVSEEEPLRIIEDLLRLETGEERDEKNRKRTQGKKGNMKKRRGTQGKKTDKKKKKKRKGGKQVSLCDDSGLWLKRRMRAELPEFHPCLHREFLEKVTPREGLSRKEHLEELTKPFRRPWAALVEEDQTLYKMKYSEPSQRLGCLSKPSKRYIRNILREYYSKLSAEKVQALLNILGEEMFVQTSSGRLFIDFIPHEKQDTSKSKRTQRVKEGYPVSLAAPDPGELNDWIKGFTKELVQLVHGWMQNRVLAPRTFRYNTLLETSRKRLMAMLSPEDGKWTSKHAERLIMALAECLADWIERLRWEHAKIEDVHTVAKVRVGAVARALAEEAPRTRPSGPQSAAPRKYILTPSTVDDSCKDSKYPEAHTCLPETTLPVKPQPRRGPPYLPEPFPNQHLCPLEDATERPQWPKLYKKEPRMYPPAHSCVDEPPRLALAQKKLKEFWRNRQQHALEDMRTLIRQEKARIDKLTQQRPRGMVMGEGDIVSTTDASYFDQQHDQNEENKPSVKNLKAQTKHEKKKIPKTKELIVMSHAANTSGVRSNPSNNNLSPGMTYARRVARTPDVNELERKQPRENLSSCVHRNPSNNSLSPGMTYARRVPGTPDVNELERKEPRENLPSCVHRNPSNNNLSPGMTYARRVVETPAVNGPERRGLRKKLRAPGEGEAVTASDAKTFAENKQKEVQLSDPIQLSSIDVCIMQNTHPCDNSREEEKLSRNQVGVKIIIPTKYKNAEGGNKKKGKEVEPKKVVPILPIYKPKPTPCTACYDPEHGSEFPPLPPLQVRESEDDHVADISWPPSPMIPLFPNPAKYVAEDPPCRNPLCPICNRGQGSTFHTHTTGSADRLRQEFNDLIDKARREQAHKNRDFGPTEPKQFVPGSSPVCEDVTPEPLTPENLLKLLLGKFKDVIEEAAKEPTTDMRENFAGLIFANMKSLASWDPAMRDASEEVIAKVADQMAAWLDSICQESWDETGIGATEITGQLMSKIDPANAADWFSWVLGLEETLSTKWEEWLVEFKVEKEEEEGEEKEKQKEEEKEKQKEEEEGPVEVNIPVENWNIFKSDVPLNVMNWMQGRLDELVPQVEAEESILSTLKRISRKSNSVGNQRGSKASGKGRKSSIRASRISKRASRTSKRASNAKKSVRKSNPNPDEDKTQLEEELIKSILF